MGSKKRSSADLSEDVEKKSHHTDSFTMKNKKKKKKSKSDEMNPDDTDDAAPPPPPGFASSGKDMEKKKKRKASDKERKRAAAALENDDGEPPRPPKPPAVVSDSNSDAAAASSSSSLPELPLSYFRDLASPEASVREAAAASLVARLQEIQKRYEMLPDKESVDGGLMLEAEKNDGLDNCAPHLRYALRRLIRGVSSSREVCCIYISFSGSVFSIEKILTFSLIVCKTRICVGVDVTC